MVFIAQNTWDCHCRRAGDPFNLPAAVPKYSGYVSQIRHNATTVLVKPVIFAELKTGVFTLEAASAFLEQAVRRGQGNKIVIAIVIELAGFFLKLCS